MALFKKKAWLGYTLYGVILTLALLYVLFPSDAIREYVQENVQNLNPDMDFTIKKISPSIPFGMNLLETQVSLKDSPGKILFMADKTSIHPRIWSLLKGNYEFDVDCAAYDGELEGHILFKEAPFSPPFDTTFELEGIRLNQNAHLKNAFNFPIEGILSGTVSYSGTGKFPGNNKGEADIRLADCQVELTQPILSLTSVAFNEVSAKVNLERSRFNVKNVEFKGREMNGTMSGRVTLRNNIWQSRLDLRGTIEPFAELLKGLGGAQDILKMFGQQSNQGKFSFVIRGTIQKPQFKLL